MLRKAVMLIALAGLLVIALYQWFYHASLQPISVKHQQLVVNIKAGSSVKSIAKDFKAQGILEHPSVFVLLTRITQQGAKLRAGSFKVDTSWNYQELLTHLIEDKEVQYAVTLIEGMTIKDAIQVVRAIPQIQQDMGEQPVEALQSLLNLSSYPEGLLLPDTYFITADTKESQFYLRAYQAMTDLMETEWPNREADLPFVSAYEAVVAASIVEKETGVASERPLIAAAIVNRLRLGMPLQMDPTVIYGMGDAYEGKIRKKDLQTPTPYNTYTNRGLTPTPIALPSAESLYAILHPAKSDVLYFVAKGDGSHYFSNNLNAHNAAVRKYQLGQ